MNSSTPKRFPRKQATLSLNVGVKLEHDASTRDKELPSEAVLYAFTSDGDFLDSTPVANMQGTKARLALPKGAQGKSVQLVVGPPMMQDADNVLKECTLTQFLQTEFKAGIRGMAKRLTAKGAYSERVMMRTDESIELAIAPDIWVNWYWCSCVVRGRLVKRITLPDGTTQMLGVCKACVLIYEIDQLARVITELPDERIRKLRDDILKVIERRPPWPPVLREEFEVDIPEPPGPMPDALHGVRRINKAEIGRDTVAMAM